MEFQDFFTRFGASGRTKNIDRKAFPRPGKRPFELPAETGLPLNFIRLCPWEMEYVYAVARRARTGIVEIGRLNGGSTFLLACANPTAPIHSIDIAPKDDARLGDLLGEHGVGSNVHLIVGSSHEPRPEIAGIDLLFIDGDHGYDGCRRDIETWYPNLATGGHILFHDSYPLPGYGVQDAILDFLGEHPEVEIVVSPIIGAAYWHYPAGSVAHLWKRRPA